MYVNKIENRIIFKMKTGYYLEHLKPKTIKLLGSTTKKKKKRSKTKNSKNVLYLAIIEVVLVHCDIPNNDYQHDSRALYKFVPKKSFGQLSDISSENVVFLKTFNSEFSYIEVWFTEQNSKLLEIEGKINITLVINQNVKYKNDSLFSSTTRLNVICKRLWIFFFCYKIGWKHW